MDDIARLAPADRSDLFKVAAERMGVTSALIEKDFWVCWAIRRLYALPDLPVEIHFKGGTSLSKVFGLIERMSEDIDLVIDRRGLGFSGDRDPSTLALSGKTRKKLIKELKNAACGFVRDRLAPSLEASFADALGRPPQQEDWTVARAEDDDDDQTLLFAFPSIEKPLGYVEPCVRLEFGARGDPWPSVSGKIRPYAAEVMGAKFRDAETTTPLVVSAERTFWEKATALHMLHHLPAEKPLAKRLSRHYYDVFRLSAHDIGRKALSDPELLRSVVNHKMLFFPADWARYDLAKPGSIRLVPPAHRMKALQADYAAMSEEMMFGEVPEFEVIMSQLWETEERLNSATQD